jgi:hypothetical protein
MVIETDNVDDLVDELRIGGELEGVLQAIKAFGDKPGPPALHGRLIDSQIGRGLPIRPTLRATQHYLHSQRQVLGALGGSGPPGQLDPPGLRQNQVGLRPVDTGRVLQPGHPPRGELPAPLGHRLGLDPDSPRDTRVRHTLHARQNDPGRSAGRRSGNPARRTSSARSSSDSTIATTEGPGCDI